jgi:hypothetical protein
VVWTGRVNGDPASDDQVYEIDYDGGSGTHADCLPDQTLYVGTTPGGYEKGIARIRTAPPGNSGTLRIAETSEIAWSDDDYLTVVDEFGLWARHIYVDSSGNIYMERGFYDEGSGGYVNGAYTDQHLNKDPVPILGPDRVVLVDGVVSAGNTVQVGFDGTGSYDPDGGAIQYDWTDSDGVVAGGFGGTPSFTFSSAGVKRIVAHIGAVTETHTAYRRVHIFDDNNPPVTKFEITSMPAGGVTSGGWSFTVRMWDEALRSEIVDRAKIILFARDWYDGNEESVGPISSDVWGLIGANIVCIGWIAGESIRYHHEDGSVEFEVQGPQYWIERIPGFPHGIEDYDGNPTDWYEMDDNQVRKSVWSLIRWRTTATRCMDCYIPDDTRNIMVFESAVGSLWRQIHAGCNDSILAIPLCDRYGRLFIERPYNLILSTDRASVPCVMAILLQDWRQMIDITRRVVNEMAQLDASGVYYLDSDNADAFFMLSQGHIFARYGAIHHRERLALFATQAANNNVAALLYAQANNEYPAVDYGLRGNYRVFDIAPRQYVTQSITAGATERGIEWTDKQLIPTEVAFNYDPNNGIIFTTMTCEGATSELDAIGGPGDPPPSPPSPPSTPPPTPPPIPAPVPPDATYGAMILSDDQIAVTFDIDAVTPTWYDADPSNDLSGDFRNMAVKNNKAYVTTSNGLYYCSDVSAAITATISWALVKSDATAQTECGYVGEFRSIDISSTDTFCAVYHGNTGGAGAGYRGFVYFGSAGVAAAPVGYPSGPQDPTRYLHTPTGSPYQHAVYEDGGTFYQACGKGGAIGEPCVCSGSGGLAVIQEYDGFTYYRFISAVNGGYVMSYQGEAALNDYVFYGAGAWTQDPYTGVGINRDVEADAGMEYSTAMLNMYDDTNHDLYRDETLRGDCSTEFSGDNGGHAVHFLGVSDMILWVTRSAQNSPGEIIVMSDDGGLTWDNKTGNLYSVFAAWTGSVDHACIVRAFG